MNNRRVDPPQHEYDSALRSALHMAVDSLEPGAGGLDQIRAKIAAKQSARRRFGFWTTVASADGRSWWRVLLPPRGWLSAVVGAVTERFRPDPNRAGWFGLLRPAAAVTTGLFVVTAASWAVAALPSAINPPQSPKVFHTTSPAHKNRTSKHHQSYTGPSGGVTTPYGNSSGGSTGPSTPSCSPSTSPSGGTSSGGTPPPSGSPAPSSPSSTPSTSATTPTANTPSSSPTAGISSGANQASSPTSSPVPADSPVATGKALLSLDAKASGVGGAATDVHSAPPTPTDAPQPTASPTVSGPASPYPTSSPLPPIC
jgi:hypothetical protein